MVRSGICTSAFGIKAPIIKEGDNIVDAVIDSVFNATRIHNDIYDIDDNTITILNMATHNRLNQFGEADPPDTHRHFDLPASSLAIENYAGILSQTVYYINERLMQDKTSLYDLAMLNVQARNGVLTNKELEADVIFALDRKPVRKEQKLVTIFDKDVINTEYMVPKA